MLCVNAYTHIIYIVYCMCLCTCICIFAVAIVNGKYSRLLARPEYHVNIYFNLREQAVLVAVVAVDAALQSSTFKKPMEMQTLTNICTVNSNGRRSD